MAATSPTTSMPSSKVRLPLAVYVLGAGAFLVGTSELLVAGLLPLLLAAPWRVRLSRTVAFGGVALTLLVRPGGLIVAHNMNRPRPDPKFVEAITTSKELDTVFLNMHAAGMSVSVKKR